MNTSTDGLCCAGDQILSTVHTEQTVYQLRHISSPPSVLLRFLGRDCPSVVDRVLGPGFDLSAANVLGVEGSVPSSKEQTGSWYCRPWDNPSMYHVTILKCEAHGMVHSVWAHCF